MADEEAVAASDAPACASVMGCVEARANRVVDLLTRLQEDDDVELIHDVRVASRRLAEGLGAVRPALEAERLAGLRAWLRETRTLLAPARDADVMTQTLTKLVDGNGKFSAVPCGVAFIEMLRERRQSVLPDARAQLASTGVLERRQELMDLLGNGSCCAGDSADTSESGEADAQVEKKLGRRLRRRVRRRRRTFLRLARRGAKSGRAARLHAARIACKKIRYALELAHEAKVLDASRELKALRRLQEGLGSLNDLTVLRGQLRAFAQEAKSEERAGANKILRLLKRRRQQVVKGFVKDWPKATRRLRKVRARRTAPDMQPAPAEA